jgi:hypothetical protein
MTIIMLVLFYMGDIPATWDPGGRDIMLVLFYMGDIPTLLFFYI